VRERGAGEGSHSGDSAAAAVGVGGALVGALVGCAGGVRAERAAAELQELLAPPLPCAPEEIQFA